MTIRSSCLCGGVRWEVEGPLSLMHHCHCGRCRKAHGAPFATLVACAAEGFARTAGDELVRAYGESEAMARHFCGRCGGTVPGDPGEGPHFVPTGCMDDDPGVRSDGHIFAAHRAPWWEIRDALPRFDAYPPGYDATLLPDPVHTDGSVPGEVARGSCLCGDVAYEVEGELRLLVLCHCSRCRKARAAAHNANAFVKSDGFRWLRGEEALATWRVEGTRFAQCFCPRCGAPQPRVEAGVAAIPAASLDGDPGPATRPSFHIFTESRAPWYEIPDDGLPRFPEGPPFPGGPSS